MFVYGVFMSKLNIDFFHLTIERLDSIFSDHAVRERSVFEVKVGS